MVIKNNEYNFNKYTLGKLLERASQKYTDKECLVMDDTRINWKDWPFLGGGMLSLLPRSQRRFLKGGDIHGSLKGNGRFLS